MECTAVCVMQLSSREIEVLREVALHYTDAEIGKRMFLSAHTVRAHVKNIRQKLGARSRGHAVRIGWELNII